MGQDRRGWQSGECALGLDAAEMGAPVERLGLAWALWRLCSCVRLGGGVVHPPASLRALQRGEHTSCV